MLKAAADLARDALVLDGVSKSYGAAKALDGVSLTLRRGAFVALVGPNGAGKSTLMQLLTGLFTPDSGTISVLGHDVAREAVKALAHLGVVFQQPTLDPELTVAANLRFHAALHGMARAEAKARIAEELARFGLLDRANDRARTLSGGNRRRVELARALLHRPDFLLMDEPTVGLDPASRRDILERVLRLAEEEGVGVLWTTHLVDEAERASRIVVLDRGRVRFDGEPAALVEATGAPNLGEAFLTLTGRGEAALG